MSVLLNQLINLLATISSYRRLLSYLFQGKFFSQRGSSLSNLTLMEFQSFLNQITCLEFSHRHLHSGSLPIRYCNLRNTGILSPCSLLGDNRPTRQGTIKTATKADSNTEVILVGCTELPSLLLAKSGAWLIHINQGSSCVHTSIYYSHTPFLEFRKVSRLQISSFMIEVVKLFRSS